MLACNATLAATPQEPSVATPDATQAVFVNAMRDPVNKSYRRMLKGMELFEKNRAVAPGASLRYKLLPRQADTRMDGIVLEVVAETITIPVPVAADRTFTLEIDPIAVAENAAVMPNRKASSLTWRTEIRTPGLAANMRRLGDLRLECRVGIEAGLVSNTLPVIGRIAELFTGDFCSGSDTPYLFFADRPLFGVTMVSGSRREVLSVDDLYAGVGYGRVSTSDLAYCDCQVLVDRSYFLPLGDGSWPDDTLIEFEYMDSDAEDPRAPSAAVRSNP